MTARAPRSTSARKAPASSKKAEKAPAPTGICKGHEIEGAKEAGLRQVQFWPTANPKDGFLGFVQITYHRLVIRDVVCRENRNEEIYASMPAKATGEKDPKTGKAIYRDYCFFLKADEKLPNEREILNEMLAVAVNRAESCEEAPDEE